MQFYTTFAALFLLAVSANGSPTPNFFSKVVPAVSNGLKVSPTTAKIALGATAATAGIMAADAIESNHIQKHAKFDFKAPSASTKWECGETYEVVAHTYLMGAHLPFANSTLVLKDNNYQDVELIMNIHTKDFIEAETDYGSFDYGVAKYNWTIPTSYSSGTYQLEYNNINKHHDGSRLRFVSKPFEIVCDDFQNDDELAEDGEENEEFNDKEIF